MTIAQLTARHSTPTPAPAYAWQHGSWETWPTDSESQHGMDVLARVCLSAAGSDNHIAACGLHVVGLGGIKVDRIRTVTLSADAGELRAAPAHPARSTIDERNCPLFSVYPREP